MSSVFSLFWSKKSMKSRESPQRTHNLRQNNSYFLFCQAFFSKIPEKNYVLNQNRLLPVSLHICNALPVTRGFPISGDEKSGVNSILHDSQICPKSSFALVQQRVLDFRFQNVIFQEKPEVGAHHPRLVNNPGSVPLGTIYL